jgi:hypothetical protein
MLLMFWVLLLLVGTCLILLMPALWIRQTYDTYRGKRIVCCPETHAPVTVRFRALHAAVGALSHAHQLELADCSRWPVHADCKQECIPDAVLAPPVLKQQDIRQASSILAHLPILVGAAAAWLLGALWHSQYTFRARWAAAIDLPDSRTLDLARAWTPHLLTAAACLVFAYAVGSLLAWFGSRTLLRGLQAAISLWVLAFAVVIALTPSEVRSDFLWIEGGYTFLAAILIGIIVGAAPRRILVRDLT